MKATLAARKSHDTKLLKEVAKGDKLLLQEMEGGQRQELELTHWAINEAMKKVQNLDKNMLLKSSSSSMSQR